MMNADKIIIIACGCILAQGACTKNQQEKASSGQQQGARAGQQDSATSEEQADSQRAAGAREDQSDVASTDQEGTAVKGDPIQIAQSWLEAVGRKDIDGLIAHAGPSMWVDGFGDCRSSEKDPQNKSVARCVIQSNPKLVALIASLTEKPAVWKKRMQTVAVVPHQQLSSSKYVAHFGKEAMQKLAQMKDLTMVYAKLWSTSKAAPRVHEFFFVFGEYKKRNIISGVVTPITRRMTEKHSSKSAK